MRTCLTLVLVAGLVTALPAQDRSRFGRSNTDWCNQLDADRATHCDVPS
jgi:hypothetical protein